MVEVKITYSIGAALGGDGIGYTALNAVKGLFRRNYLEKAICVNSKTDEINPNLVVEIKILQRIKRKRVLSDNSFDLLASRHIKDCDVFHGWNSKCLFSLYKARKHRAKTVVERASSHILTQNKLLSGEYENFGLKNKPIDRYTILKCKKEYETTDFITVPSKFAYNSFLEYGFDEKKLWLIPFGVDTEIFKPSEKSNNIFRILFVGQISLRKGVQHLLKAFSEMNLKNAELILRGSIKPDIRDILDYYKKKIDFRIIKFAKQNELVKLFNSSSVFVLPSIEEGSALVTYEAMACGLPLIVTENSGAVAINGKHGFTIPIRDSSAIKEKIEYFYHNEKDRRKMGNNARKYVQQYFTWDKYAENLIKHYKNVL
ncbi:MAG: glycosyltransferase family 4 protein [Candidatus Helarchaeota archaeon]|nr:glycosyltransferase family 4 protein [Candidatus Helarchaeota archaeon]